MPHFSDDLRLGTAQNPIGTDQGFGPLGRIYVFDVVPVTLQTAGIAALQTLGAAGNFTLTAGTGASTGVDRQGNSVIVLDTPRCVTFTSTGNISGVNMTITGYDEWWNPITQTRAGPNNNTVSTTKAFKYIRTVAASGAVGTNTSVGFNDILGLPVRVTDAGYLASVKWAGALAADAGTFVAADTAAATSSTGDARGTYTPSSAANGSRRLVIGILMTAIQVGPNATLTGLRGSQ